MLPRALPIRTFSALILALFSVLAYQIWSEGPTALWDFQTYYAAAKAHQAGLNPYDLDVLCAVFGRDLQHPYVYPPWTLYAFRPFIVFDYSLASGLFITAKVLSLSVLVLLWQRLLGNHLLLLLLTPLAFAGAALVDLHAGNIAIFEQTCLWLGFACYMRGRLRWFVAFILLAASFKVLPIAFLALLLLTPDRGGLRRLAGALAIFAGICLGQVWFLPDLSSAFFSALDLADERGSLNPCSQAFWGSLLHFCEARGMSLGGAGLRWSLYALTTAVVLGLSLRAMSVGRQRSSLQLILFATLCYSLMVPRFKDYSYLLLVPAACAQCLALRGSWRPWIAALLFCLPTHSLGWIRSEGLRGILAYYPLYCALALWLLALGAMKRDRVHADQHRQPPR